MFSIDLVIAQFVEGLSLRYFLIEITNYIFLLSVLMILFWLKKITRNELIFFSVYCCTPLLFNFILFPDSYFVDQRSYLACTTSIKEGLGSLNQQYCGFTNNPLSNQVAYASLIFSFVPIPFFLTVTSGAFAVKLIFLLFYTFYLKEKFEIEKYLLIFLAPSLILYSSLFLRDFLIMIFSSIILIECLLWRKKTLMLIPSSLVILLLIKPQNAAILLIFLLIWTLLKAFNFRAFGYIAITILLSLITIFFGELILNTINFYIRAFAIEEGFKHSDIGLYSFEYESIFSLIISLIPNTLKAIFVPYLWNSSGLFQLLQSIENLILFFLISIFIFKIIQERQTLITIQTFIIFIFFFGLGMAMYGTIIFNYGSLVRYKFGVIGPFLLLLPIILQKSRKWKEIKEY